MSRPGDPSRDLLFGLLALQNGLIDQGALFAAFAAWARDRDRPLADHLVDLGHLDASRRAAVEAIADLHVETLGGDPGKSLAALAIGRSTRESLARAGGPGVETTLGHVGPAQASTRDGYDPELDGGFAIGSATSDGQRFRVLRPHARGGLGAVFVALDSELDREVALKQILDDRADDPMSRFRFLIEARITGGLEHPGIVPVYGLGTHSDGRPYYAMRFIRGDSLKEAIDHFHAAPLPGGPTGSRDLALRKLLRRFLDVCNAIDYAHSRGVIHRDIKPANIILGQHGETLVVDWGLAKPTGYVGPEAELGERSLMPSPASGGSETLPGSTLGTPAYMSPEQAGGRLDRVGPRSDIYSLGATLYCLLTGKPPFAGKVADMLGAAQRGEFPPPRQLDPSIDKALEAVCLKAMALEPEDRYETPRALADDIEHWLADEPVKAHPEHRLERLGRWLRQHRTWTYAAVAALIGISLATTIGVVVVDRARRREADVRKEAEANFNMALKAVDDYLTSVSENTLFKLQDSVDIRRLRQELLTSALGYYKGFVNQRSHDPRLRRQLADAYFRVGEITREVETPDQAIGAYHAAQAIWEPLVAAHPADSELRGHLAESYLAVGHLLNTVGNLDSDGAMRSLDRARAILEPLAAANPLAARYQSSLADCYSEIASVQARRQQPGETLVLLEKARAIEKGLINRYPDQHAYRKSLAEITNVLGYAYYKKGDNDEALKSFREVQDICLAVSKQVTVGPKPLWLLNLMALSHSNIGWIHGERRELQDAINSLELALEYRTALVDSHPSVTSYKVNLATTCREIAAFQHELHQDAEAFQSIRRSVDVLKALVRSQPDQGFYHAELGLSWNYLGIFYDGARKNTEALAAFEQAVAEQQVAVDKVKGSDQYRVNLANHLDNLGETYVDRGQVDRGLPHYNRAIRIRRQLFTTHPGQRFYLLDLAQALSALGNIQRHAGDSTAARESFSDSRSLLERAAAASPDDGALQVSLGAALVREACALADLREPENARPLLELAVKILTDPSVSPSEEAQRREWRSEGLWELARILRVLNDAAEADRVDARRVALWRDRPPGELATLTLKETTLAASIGYGKTPVPPAALAVRDLDLDLAEANLRLAVARGFRDLRMLKAHPDYQVLLSREDIKLLIMDMAFPDRPFGD